MLQLRTFSLLGAATYGTSTRRFEGSQFPRSKVNHLSLEQDVSAKAALRSIRCNATQTQSVQKKSSSATVQRDKKGKVQGPKLDDGSGGFPPFRFGKGGGGGGGGGGGSNYFGGFLLFSCVLLLDYLKEFEKYLLTRRHLAGDDAGNQLLQE
ncbi:protein FERTILITY RESTORER RF2, mitochondrial-like isoform X1 [Phragmites australis]|uniref:protein FERTILITY RESTORER RF2, mitochondrial-like isoform X1 n=1 Tax=Phragmites australis TaxID=29695 RepID=UPI002D780F1C|nr:protein FERTILITY RESTORER RF2, mitochondrial-like isoform X1 [Phragmites australis]XP_062218821.1 protein FERTILITY RESTORER RF2, mitochondrial-like isoform X1 [Phragmites australis]XP_062218822.1 protein FERTILITY RESTORER RF2, mitochondrial-like isoform X1 [Phragmites australis]XP_062218823.1 protein FERTILITY RESTORER RF2, mitochondrial-like isoform X1 [Phragmites australis]